MGTTSNDYPSNLQIALNNTCEMQLIRKNVSLMNLRLLVLWHISQIVRKASVLGGVLVPRIAPHKHILRELHRGDGKDHTSCIAHQAHSRQNTLASAVSLFLSVRQQASVKEVPNVKVVSPLSPHPTGLRRSMCCTLCLSSLVLGCPCICPCFAVSVPGCSFNCYPTQTFAEVMCFHCPTIYHLIYHLYSPFIYI